MIGFEPSLKFALTGSTLNCLIKDRWLGACLDTLYIIIKIAYCYHRFCQLTFLKLNKFVRQMFCHFA